MNHSIRFIKSASIAVVLGLSMAGSPAMASEDTLVNVDASAPLSGTVELKYLNGRVEVSSPLWTGQIPTSVSPKKEKYKTCQTLKFPVQALLPYDDMRADVSITFEIWSPQGEKMDSTMVWYDDWNPTNGPTIIPWLSCDVWQKAGSYTLIVRTKDTVSTNGLLTRYVEGVQQVPFTILPAKNTRTVKCIKGRQVTEVTGEKPKCPKGFKRSK
jgi:hypothetical protein